ncbi:MerR family transcriptional regulator [Actinomadura fibrosa]|uniref:MerR family transcriptional regulator n=1 Tax=Actinomadura fibrosa TaxID=111802 RepID=A0ABW2XSS7_9ACTN|nr:MerR family transcriptional regulator [Actinomadura fibrosa]
MAEYRIDDLARAAGTTVRHVRGFQERGLLPPPRMRGRVGYYDDTHLARINLIGRLKDRGYTLASIVEMLSAWERGHDLGDLLGLERVIHDPWSDEAPAYMSLPEVVRMFYPDVPEEVLEGRGPDDFGTLGRAEELEFIRWTGDRYEVPSPRLLEVGAQLVAAGIRLSAVFDIAEKLRGDVDEIARRFVRLTVDHAGFDTSQVPEGTDFREIADTIRRLRPAGILAVQGLLARALHAEIQAEFTRQIEHLGPRPRPAAGAEPGGGTEPAAGAESGGDARPGREAAGGAAPAVPDLPA